MVHIKEPLLLIGRNRDTAAGFPCRYLNGRLPYVRRHINKNALNASLNKTLFSFLPYLYVCRRIVFCHLQEQMIENEVCILRKVKHPNIVLLVEDYDTTHEVYMVMELVKVRVSKGNPIKQRP